VKNGQAGRFFSTTAGVGKTSGDQVLVEKGKKRKGLPRAIGLALFVSNGREKKGDLES